MASGGLIATAVALILLIITAYVIIGGILATTEIVSAAQTDKFNHQEARMRTDIEITGSTIVQPTGVMYLQVENTGKEIISGFEYFDLHLIFRNDKEPVYYSYSSSMPGTGEWTVEGITPDSIHKNQLDPGETLNLTVQFPLTEIPEWVQITTPNGVYDSGYVN
ncbi:hypothetical protein AZH53_02540 [Methanomicrobiaceae archaeon CYW5]|uniref:hypothetical protein n=1 Tax=Methanovulcanius yangii TaxID=1789227 RepID=UPI0029CAA608|nr:hypothetical protein [Methanovulcanius yangii]MBT8507308.1 hypothetical protein [Methanovulcanius yangii]